MSQSNSALPISRSRKGACLLIVEDNPDHWIIIQQVIQITFPNVQVSWVSNLQEALVFLKECLNGDSKPPFMVLLDLYLPERETGWELLRQIRSLPTPIGKLPIIALSSSRDAADINESYDRGVTTYLIKPTDFDSWTQTFQVLKKYWLDTVLLPPTRIYH